MAKNVTVAWTLPTTRLGGGALPPGEIAHVAAELSADGGSIFTPFGNVLPTDAQQVFVPDMEVGQWQFRLTVVDTLGQSSAPHVEVVDVIDDSPPNSVGNVTVTQN